MRLIKDEHSRSLVWYSRIELRAVGSAPGHQSWQVIDFSVVPGWLEAGKQTGDGENEGCMVETETRKRAHREVNQGKLLGSLSWEALFCLVPRGGFQAGGAAVPNPAVGCPGLCKSSDARWWE